MKKNEGFTCPACRKDMHMININGADLEACSEGCGGIWFDSAELFRLDTEEKGEGSEVLKKLFSLAAMGKTDTPEKKECIKCGNKMKRHEYREGSGVFVDECYSCGGLWLDGGELKSIHKNPSVRASNLEREKMEKEFSEKVQTEKQRLEEQQRKRFSKKRI